MAIEDKRALARKLQRQAGKKISYNKMAKGIFTADTQYDPRVPAKRLSRYNNEQLDRLIVRLQKFNSRGTQFVSGYQGVPIPAKKYKEYVKAASSYNRMAQSRAEKWEDVFVPSTGQTVKQRRSMLKKPHHRMDVPADYAPTQISIISPEKFLNEKGVDMSVAEMKRRLTDEYWQEKRKLGRDNYAKMAREINSAALRKAAKSLTEEQFAFLWEATSFATEVALAYELIVDKLQKGNAPRYVDPIVKQRINSALNLIEEVKTLDI